MAKSITLATDQNIGIMYYYDAGAGTYTSRSLGNGQDYFDDDFGVGDCLYVAPNYGGTGWPPMGFLFNVSVPIFATSYELIWEYYDSDTTWKELIGLVDDTQSFSVVGSNYVRWQVQRTTQQVSVNGILRTWVRCRVVAVNTPTEGGKQSATNILFKPNSILLNGGTIGDPITMSDIAANADVITWGLVEQIGTNNATATQAYIVRCLIINSTDSWFKAINTTIFFNPGYTSGGIWQYGEAVSRHPRTGWKGCCVIFQPLVNDNLLRWACQQMYAYSTKFMSSGGATQYSTNYEMYGCTFNDVTIYGGKTCKYVDCNIDVINSYLSPSVYNYEIDGGNFAYLYAYQNSAGLIARNARASYLSAIWSTKIITYDCTYSALTTWTSYVASSTGVNFYIHYSISLTIQDTDKNPIEGVTVSIVDKDGNPAQSWVGDTSGGLENVDDFTTDSNGESGLIDLLHYHKNVDHLQNPPVHTNTTYSDFTITMSKAGYQTKTMKLTMDKQREEVVVLEKAIKWIAPQGKKVIVNLDNTNSQNKYMWD